MRTKQVIVLPYDASWKTAFNDIRRELEAALGDLAVGIEHVGSTSVEGLSAKPIIDIDVVIRDYSVFDAVVRKLASAGYIHEGDLGIQGREAFKYTHKPHLQKHHLYVCPQDSAELRRHITFRDFLRSNPDAVQEYSAVKETAARLYPEDIDGSPTIFWRSMTTPTPLHASSESSYQGLWKLLERCYHPHPISLKLR